MTMNSITEHEVLALLRTSYHIIPRTLQRIDSYENVNYLIRVPRDEDASKNSDVRYLMKIFVDWDDIEHVEMQHSMMVHLNKCKIPVSEPISAITGESFIRKKFGGSECIVQVLTFLEGQSVNSANLSKDEFMKVSWNVGIFLGRIHEALKNYSCAKVKEAPLRTSKVWYTENTLLIEEKLTLVKDLRLQNLARRYLDLFRENFVPRVTDLRQGFIHGDVSDTNILLACSGQKWDVVGLIDFEDNSYRSVIGDVGICVAYFMLKSATIPGSDPIQIAKRIIEGYQTVYTFTSVEKEVLFEVVCGRLVVSYVKSIEHVLNHPENEEFLLLQAKHVPTIFQVLESVGREKVLKLWFLT